MRTSLSRALRFVYTICCIATVVVTAVSCTRTTPSDVQPRATKVGVLLVSHGSRSETWRRALEDLDARVRGGILADGKVNDVKSAFMEYTEPSIATRMKEFDKEGFSDVVIVPVFLTVSPHPFDDIPTILGQKTNPQSLETIKLEGIERYTPTARVQITPLLDFTDLLQKNVVRRVKSLSTDPDKEGLVLVAYGDETYEKEWSALLDNVAEHVRSETKIGVSAHAWCGHVVQYDPGKTTTAIETVLQSKQRAIVVPVLVAKDERFQVKLIGDAISRVENASTRVVYRADSILPDERLDDWVVTVTSDVANKIEAKVGDIRR